MKIRAGFVSNSSSTSFLIVAKDDLNETDFLELMGVNKGSPLTKVFRELYEAVQENCRVKVDFKNTNKRVPPRQWFSGDIDRMSAHMLDRIDQAASGGLKVYYGHLSSDTSTIQCFFCTDSFEVENEKIYFNGLECVW
ncbi:MAG: hypothetical protein ABSC38_07125 [Verrucomicrobiia bacterium]